VLEIDTKVYAEIMAHLMPRNPRSEEAAFAFCTPFTDDGHIQFSYLDWYRPSNGEFSYKSIFGLELTDDCRAKVIKRAHDLNASIIEMHSHPLSKLPQFSPSDRHGFIDFVPHVRWRLRQRPYAAIVVGRDGFDSLAWFSSSDKPDGVLDVQVESTRLCPTSETYSSWEEADDFEI
jgi:hypothetical protein